MVDERPEDTPPPDSGRAKRAPPTIDLEASEVSGETQNAGMPKPKLRPGDRSPWPSRDCRFPPAVIAAVFRRRRCRAGDRRGLDAQAGPASRFRPRPPLRKSVPQPSMVSPRGSPASNRRPARRRPRRPIPRRPRASRRWRNRWRRCAANSQRARAQSEKLAAALNDVKSTPRESPPRAGPLRHQRAHRADRARHARAGCRDRAGKRQARR